MRIVAGDFRGRSIDAPQGSGTRPTTDRVREALMSSLYSLLGGFDGQCVLDAFAGSGALGLEALSRGAEKADFFESNKGAFRTLRSNIAACGIGADRASAYNADVVRSCEAGGGAFLQGGCAPYTLVFLDPPYAFGAQATASLVAGLRDAGALADGAVIVYEHDQAASREIEEVFADCAIVSVKKYGKTGVAFMRIAERGTVA